jgi:hypothetical protein
MSSFRQPHLVVLILKIRKKMKEKPKMLKNFSTQSTRARKITMDV